MIDGLGVCPMAELGEGYTCIVFVRGLRTYAGLFTGWEGGGRMQVVL